jgi:hypothetical protein
MARYTELDNRYNRCLNSRLIISENGFHYVCCLTKGQYFCCIMGVEDWFVREKGGK